MEFNEQGLTFREADRRYADLERRHDAGQIGDEEFDAQRRQLMIRDDKGRWWAKSRGTGEWFYHDGGDWIRVTPPGYHQDVRDDRPMDGPDREVAGTTTGKEQTGTTTGEIRYLWDGIPNSMGGWSLLFGLANGVLVIILVIGYRYMALQPYDPEPTGPTGYLILNLCTIAFLLTALVAVGLGVVVILGRRRDKLHAQIGIALTCLAVAVMTCLAVAVILLFPPG